MKAEDLRLGNLFREQYSGEVIEVIELKKDTITFTGKFTGKWQAEPIPLTEEWLIKSNAKKVSDERLIYVLDRFRLIWKKEYKYWYVVDSVFMTYMNKIEFVHKWQNFYFVMQGEELKIK